MLCVTAATDHMKTPSFFQRSELAATLWKFRREFIVCTVFSIVVNLLMLTPTLYMLQVFDRVMLSASELTLVALTLIMLFFFGILAFSEWARSRLLVRLGVKLDDMLNSRVFNASFESYLNRPGSNPNQAFNDLTNLRQFLTGMGVFAIMDAPWIPIYIIVLYMLHPWLGMLSIIFALMLVGVAYISHRMTYQPIEKSMETGNQANSYVHSKLRNAQVIEAMGMIDNLRRLWQVRHRDHLRVNSESQDISERMKAVTKFMRYTQQSLTLAAGAVLVIQGEMTAGAMVAANALMSRATAPIDLMVGTWKMTLGAQKSYLRLESLLKDYPERDAGLVHGVPQGHMRIENLVATAPNRKQPILKGLTADFPAGQTIAVIGPSGSGKSTLARSLIGIWQDMEGKVLIDGEPIQSWNRAELGPHIGYLPQDIELFEGSIAENIARFGVVDPHKIIRAAQRAGVHDMILRFPRGYDTSMGEAGSLLSGGQRQRIGLARAMYDDPAVIVLDEPNANLDDAGEAALVAAVQDLHKQGKTVFLITHRLNIVGVADRIMVLNDGNIQLYGARDEVIAALQPKQSPPPPESPAVNPAAQPA